MSPPAKAQWSAGKPTSTTAADGTFTASIPLLDSGSQVATIVVTITADRAFRLEFDAAAGVAAPLTGFEAWSRGV